MRFRVVTLNLEQDHKRWEARRPLIADEIGRLRPDIVAFNEVSVPLQTARACGDAAAALTGIDVQSGSADRASTACPRSRARRCSRASR